MDATGFQPAKPVPTTACVVKSHIGNGSRARMWWALLVNSLCPLDTALTERLTPRSLNGLWRETRRTAERGWLMLASMEAKNRKVTSFRLDL